MRKKILTSIAILSSLMASSANSYEPIPMDPKLKYGILDNGLTYYVKQNKTTKERACFYIVQNVGAILEEDSQNGLAHFLEHMAFQGTKNLPGKMLIEYLETVGVKFGANINAYTALDETVYNLDEVPTYREGIVDTALTILHDWSSFLTLEDKEIDKERGVIVEEWRTRNKANRRMWTASLPIIFKNSQYAKRNVIGDTAIIKNFAYDTLRSYYRKWYRPDLQAIIVVGDVDADTIVSKIKKMFSDIPKRENPAPRPIYQLEDNKEPIVAIITDEEAKNNLINIDFRHKPVADNVKASLVGYYYALVQNLATSMINDRFEELSQEKDSPFASAYTNYGEVVKSKDAFSLYVVPNKGKEKMAFDRLMTEIARLNKYGFKQTELDRAKVDLTSALEKAFNERNKAKNKSFVDEYKRNFLDFEPVPGIEWECAATAELLSSLNIDIVNTMLRDGMLSKENITVEICGQEMLKDVFNEDYVANKIKNYSQIETDDYVDNTKNEPLISKEPKAGKIKGKSYNKDLDFTEYRLDNGARVIIKKTTFKDDEILLSAFSNGGYSLMETNQMPSAKVACSIAQNNGLGQFNATDLRKNKAGKIANINTQINYYDHTITGNSSVKDFEYLLQLLYMNFNGIREDEISYNAVMSQYKTALSNRSLDPNSAFSDSINATLYNHSPRVTPLDTTALTQITEKEALDIYKSLFKNPSDFTFVLTGNIDMDKHMDIILKYVGGIKNKDKKNLKWIDRNIRTAQGDVKCHFEKKLQTNKTSNFIYYSTELEPTSRNKIALQIIKGILSTRYLESMRENKSGTYGVGTYAGMSIKPKNEAYLEMSFDTDPEQEDSLLPIIHKEIQNIIDHGPKDEDVNKTKEILIKNHKERIEENGYWQKTIITYLKDNMNDDKDYDNIVKSISNQEIVDLMKKIVDSGNRIEVVMSPKK